MPPWEVALNKYWVSYMAKTSARDKMFRFAQYAMRAIYFQLQQSGAPKDTTKWAKHVYKTLSTGRKFARMGKFIDNWYKAYKHLKKKAIALETPKDIINLLSLLVYIADMIFYFWDALAWMEAAKVSSFPGMKVKHRRNQWNAIRYGLKMIKGTFQIQYDKPGSIAYYSHRRIAVKSALDFMNPMSSLKYYKLNDGQIGVLGVVTSSIAIYDDFNK